jgi:hypothetical protein
LTRRRCRPAAPPRAGTSCAPSRMGPFVCGSIRVGPGWDSSVQVGVQVGAGDSAGLQGPGRVSGRGALDVRTAHCRAHSGARPPIPPSPHHPPPPPPPLGAPWNVGDGVRAGRRRSPQTHHRAGLVVGAGHGFARLGVGRVGRQPQAAPLGAGPLARRAHQRHALAHLRGVPCAASAE